MKRFALYKQGYVHEDGTITEAKLVRTSKKRMTEIPVDHFTCEEEFDGVYWITIEDSEVYN